MIAVEYPQVSPPSIFTASKQKVGALVARAWLVAVTVLAALIIADPNAKYLMDFVV